MSRTLFRNGRTRVVASALVSALAGSLVALAATPAVASIGPDGSGGIAFDAGYLRVDLSSSGQVASLIDTRTNVNYVATGQGTAPLVSLVVDGHQVVPTAVALGANNTLAFTNSAAGVEVDVAAVDKTTYTTLEVTNVTAPAGADIQTVLWGPVATKITQTTGEAVGVVHDSTFAIGMKVLNDRTEGGWPREDLTIGWQNQVNRLPYSVTVGPQEQWAVAARTSWGSILRAYTFDYTKPRNRMTFGSWASTPYSIPIAAMAGTQGSVVGSKVALFGTTPDMALTVLSNVANEQGLPYPTINGQWQKVAQDTLRSYLAGNDLSASNFSQAVQYAKSGGLDTVYGLLGNNNGPWQADGHYLFNSAWGGDDASATSLVTNAAASDVVAGVHTLSDFIEPQDAYVQPTPNADLVRGLGTTLSRDLATTDTTAYLSSCTPLATVGVMGSRIIIGNEFLTYTAYSQVGSECQLTGLQHAQWSSVAVAHTAGDSVDRIPENEYKGAFGNLNIIQAMATRFAALVNNVGMKAVGFDGLESASESGLGSYGMATIVNQARRQITNNDGVLFEASRLGSNIWDAMSRIGWGERWQALSQILLNQEYLHANFMPASLGWRDLKSTDTLMSVEGGLALNAGFNAGVTFRATLSDLAGGTTTAQQLDLIKQWETARNLGAFSTSQRVLLQDSTKNWHLSVVTPGKAWSLQQLDASGNPIGAAQTVAAPTPAFTSTTLPSLGVGQLYEARVQTNNPETIRYAVTSGSLPAGLSLNRDTGGITGVPTSDAVAAFTITGTGGDGTANAVGTFRIAPYAGGGALNLASRFNNVGVTSQSNVKPGNFDGSYHDSFSAEQLAAAGIKPGTKVSALGTTLTWPIAPAGAPDNVSGGSAIISANGLSGNAITFLGSSAGAASGPVTVTYTDGTSTTATLGFPNWVTSTPTQYGATTVATTTGRNMPSGYGDTGRQFLIFANQISIDPTRHVYSVTLPSSTAIHIFAATVGTVTTGPLNLASKFNNVGVTSQSATTSGNFDGGYGDSYSAEQLANAGVTPGSTVTAPGASFLWPSAAAGTADNIAGGSAVISATGLAGSKIAFLGAGAGTTTGTVTVTYADGTTSTGTLGFPNWVTATPNQYGATPVVTTTGRNLPSGYGDTARKFQLFYNEIAIDPTKTISTVKLPASGAIHVFAATVSNAQAGQLDTSATWNNVGVTSQSNTAPGNFDGSGNSYSADQLATLGITPGATVSAGPVSFTWPSAPVGTPNNAAGSTTAIQGEGLGGSRISFLGSAATRVSGAVLVTYTDGTSTVGTIGFPKWVGDPSWYGSTLVASTTGVNSQTGYGDTGHQYQVFANDMPIDPTKTIATITLPSNPQIHIFAASVYPGS